MKKNITRLGFSVLIIAAIVFTAATTQDEKKGSKKEHQNPAAKKNKGPKAAKINSGNADNNGHNQSKKNKEDKKRRNEGSGNQTMDNENSNKGKYEGHDNKENHDEKMDKGKNDDMSYGNRDISDGYKWDRETFKHRNKYKNQEKVTLCHKFNRDNEPPVTINVSAHAVKAHIKHGDVVGSCPVVTNSRFSKIYEGKRKDYYNSIQNSDEQLSYSRSILNYAMVRLADSRQKLTASQNHKMPLADIKRKEASVAQLEQNVSLLENLIGVAAELVLNKL